MNDSETTRQLPRYWLMILLVTFGMSLAVAGDGRVEINQASALAGGVTASDTPGFPVTLDATGSYLLTGNLSVSGSGSSIIEITAPSVSLDLNGFTITAGSSTDYIIFVNQVPGVTIHNGSIVHPGSGLGIELLSVANFVIRHVHFRIKDTGIYLEGSSGGGDISHNVFEAYDSSARAISLGGFGKNRVSFNTTKLCGISVGSDGNIIADNVINGLQSSLIISSGYNQIENNLMTGGDGWGLYLGAGATGNVYRGNTARDNTGTVGICNNVITNDFCNEGPGNTSHGDNYLPTQM